jgi:hypothetical protein
MRKFLKNFLTYLEDHSSIGIVLLIIIAIVFCMSALLSPFWSDNDTWSNLLPIIHYRQSTLVDHILPNYTTLWYGGRYQWMNPLWSFLYLPTTLIWLIFPLDWGARIIFTGHLIFALIIAERLASLFLDREWERLSFALILVSPMIPALIPGHIEKVMAWPWVLTALYFLHSNKLSAIQKGVLAGLSWGIVALTGANYYVFYLGILLIPLLSSFKNIKLFLSFVGGASIGLLHLPSVWYLLGYARANAAESIRRGSTDLIGIVTSLSLGLSKPLSWESWALIGLPIVLLFLWVVFKTSQDFFNKQPIDKLPQKLALFISLIVLGIFSTNFPYSMTHLFDTFRVPVRAVSFVALAVTLLVLYGYPQSNAGNKIKYKMIFRILLLASVIQVILFSWMIRPLGSIHSPYDLNAEQLATTLKRDGSQSVWFSMQNLNDTYIEAVLTQNNLALPNAYYGDMGQKLIITGNHCGFSFDHLIALTPDQSQIRLKSDLDWIPDPGHISITNLLLLKQMTFDGKEYSIYRVVC